MYSNFCHTLAHILVWVNAQPLKFEMSLKICRPYARIVSLAPSCLASSRFAVHTCQQAVKAASLDARTGGAEGGAAGMQRQWQWQRQQQQRQQPNKRLGWDHAAAAAAASRATGLLAIVAEMCTVTSAQSSSSAATLGAAADGRAGQLVVSSRV
jgi:hypothetical protein